MTDLPPLPPPQEPITNKETGQIRASWYRWFQLVDLVLRENRITLDDHEDRITALEP